MIKVLVIAAHPDDEVLGCGGTITRHAAAGDEVHVVILAEGVTSRDKIRKRSRRSTELLILAETAHAANKILGARSLTLHDLPDNRLDAINLLDVVKLVENHLHEVTPDIVYTHHAGDLNIDHRRVHDAVITACRPLPGQTVKTLLFFEVPSSTEWQPPGSAPSFSPDWFIDVSKTLPTKLQALRAYQAEMKPWPHPRSLEAVEHLARWRGASVGVTAAEAYVLGRNLVR